MSKFDIKTLTEGIRQRHLGEQNHRLVEKWSRTGLLRGLDGVKRENMAMLLENQAAQVLRESSSIGIGGGSATAGGDIQGFTNIAFPIVRRVFGGLVANELVSVQPMSLPSGLLFYLDYTYGTVRGQNLAADGAVYTSGSSIYGNPTGKAIQGGALESGGMYDLAGSGYSRVYADAAAGGNLITSGAFRGGTAINLAGGLVATGSDGALLGFDPVLTTLIEGNASLTAGANVYTAVVVKANALSSSDAPLDLTAVKEIGLFAAGVNTPYKTVSAALQGSGRNLLNIRRLNQLVRVTPAGATGAAVTGITPISTATDVNSAANPDDIGILMIVSGVNAAATQNAAASLRVQYPVASGFSASPTSGASLVVPVFESNFGATPSPEIPEIDIKIESIPVVAEQRKLRARWSPELAQDLNAYHSLDAEVELTQILSAQVALEIDREILNDLLMGASGANYFWSRAPGKFVNKTNGVEVSRATGAPGPAFTGTVREWYETLVETIIDVGNTIHRKTLRGSANFVVVGPDVATILEASVYYRPVLSIDSEGQVSTPFSMGAEKVGSLSNRFTVYKDPYFPRNKILVGFKGGSYLETGYVYAPYVPLIVTPTIFAPEDFTPRKGVMTRYGKKMVRSDFFGTVTCLDMNII